MKLATYLLAGRQRIGMVVNADQEVTEICAAELGDGGMQALIERLAGGTWQPTGTGIVVPLSDVTLVAPLPRPRRNLWCVGRNYRAHAEELSNSVFRSNDARADNWPIVFTKVPECVVGPFDEVELPTGVSECVDYEAELAVVIGRSGKNITRTQAMDHVFGYTVLNDVTARDVQMRHQQWDMGKSFDTFCPMGPWIVTADEMPETTRLRCWVNGELRQDGHTRDLIFDIPALIETVSRGITLYPGDVIATGTPAGVGMGMAPPRYLTSGDVVRIEVDGVGAIENSFI